MENYQVKDISLLINKKITNISSRSLKTLPLYSSKIKKYWEQQLKELDIEILDDDDSSSNSVIILDTNKIFKNKEVKVNIDLLNIIKMPIKQVTAMETFYLGQLPVIHEQSYVVDNSLELYRLREENKKLKEEIARLKYLSEKNNNV